MEDIYEEISSEWVRENQTEEGSSIDSSKLKLTSKAI